jgi:hypothetical protein
MVNQIGSKSTKECIQFYYLWKKVCPDDYKRLRILRRRRNQSQLYNLRSQENSAPSTQHSINSGLQEEEEFEEEGEEEDDSELAINGTVSTPVLVLTHQTQAVASTCLSTINSSASAV